MTKPFRLRVMAAPMASAIAILCAGQAFAQTVIEPPADWGRALREDAQAFHDIVEGSHPGPVDAQNPGFRKMLDEGLALARTRATSADSYADWYFALEEYAASFDDGHLTLNGYQRLGHVWSFQWPGFMTGIRPGPQGDRQEVVFNQDAAAPPVGAVLVSCDGRDAEAFAAEIVGRTAGRWGLRSRRVAFASTVFLDQTNPYVRRAERCIFEVDGGPRIYDLAWRDLPAPVRDEGFAVAATPRFDGGIRLRPWSRGQWLELGSFDSDPQSDAGRRLTTLTAEIVARRPELRSAHVLVFDLRGNSGGSSSWINDIARTIWGEAWVAARAPQSTAVDWRVSPGNLAQIEAYRIRFADNPEVLAYMTEVADGLRQASATGAPLWRQEEDETAAGVLAEGGAAPAPTSSFTGKAYVFTDYACASACLDAVDLLTALGAVQVGQETSADTDYMEVRDEPLPSGRVTAVVPMKVYRGRARGNNETARPAFEWIGALANTDGIEAWLGEIAARP